MRLLAAAKPSKLYRWYSNFASITLEARLCNNKILYYEVDSGRERQIAEGVVKELFPLGQSIKDQPFLVRENRDFYAVLNRDRVRFCEQYLKLKNKKS